MKLKAVVLAAGKGTRLHTEGCDLPKVMRSALGRPLLHYVLDAISFIPSEETVIVVGYQKEKITDHFPGYRFAVQTEQLGTGHAVMAARELLPAGEYPVLVCYGDMPLIQRETYSALVKTHVEERNDCTILTGTAGGNLSYGRIVRDNDGNFSKVVEDKDCSPEQKAITELNSGVYVFQSSSLISSLDKLDCSNAQGEYYLTDVPAILLKEGRKIGICKRALEDEIIGVNTVEQLCQVEDTLRLRAV